MGAIEEEAHTNKKKNAKKKLSLSKETLTSLDLENLKPVVGGGTSCPQESAVICSEVHSCVSCQNTEG